MYYSIFAVHLTLEQHGFELRGSTCSQIFPAVNTTALYNLWLTECNAWIKTPKCKVIGRFLIAGKRGA